MFNKLKKLTFMKTTLLALLLLVGLQVFGQKLKPAEVPAPVMEKFKSQYAAAANTQWDKEKDDYEASFKLNNKEMSVLMNAKGEVLEVEREIKPGALPKIVQDAIVKDFQGYKIAEASIIETNGSKTYEAELKNGKDTFDAVFDVSGKLVKKVSHNKDKK